MQRKVTRYRIQTDKAVKPCTFALVCDLHGAPFDDLLEPLSHADAILIGGDLIDGYDQIYDGGLAFLREAVKLAPVYYAIGNHEGYDHPARCSAYLAQAQAIGAKLLLNAYVQRDGYCIDGVTETPNFAMLRRFERENGYIKFCFVIDRKRMRASRRGEISI